MLKVVQMQDERWAEVDHPEEAGEELPPGSRFFHPEYGPCVSLPLRRDGDHYRFWYYAIDLDSSMKVYGCGTGPFRYRLVHRQIRAWPRHENPLAG